MPENPRPPRPRRPGSYSELDRRSDRVSIEHLPSMPPPLPRRPPLIRKDSPPPVSVPTSEAERELAKRNAQLQDALEAVESMRAAFDELRREAERRAHLRVDSQPPSSRRARAADFMKVIFARYGGPLGALVALATAISAYVKPAARPEEVDLLRNEKIEARRAEVRKDSQASSYETRLRAAYDCRFAQLGYVAKKMGYELDWSSDSVVFEANQIVRNKEGFQEEKPPFKPRRGTECPPIPAKP